MTLLSVNIDHVATVREARGVDYPDPVEAARLALAAGADGITVHLRGDRRHIQDADVERLRAAFDAKLNLEIATTGEMLALAKRLGPDQVTLVPERPEEVTTEGGLDVAARLHDVERALDQLAGSGIGTSIFLDPDRRQVEALAPLAGRLAGVEINTDRYTAAHRRNESGAAGELESVAATADSLAGIGFEVYAGHGLTVDSVGPIAALEPIVELNIGHALVARAVLVGIDAAVREMRSAIAG